jgi:hypothetical protein
LKLISPASSLITVHANGNLTLGGHLNLVGLHKKTDNENNGRSLVKVNNGGKLTLADNAVIRDNYTQGHGGGVYVEAKGTFIMSGGEIRGNHADRRGGGVGIVDGGTFAKTGGTIYGAGAGNNANTADSDGKAVCVIEGPSNFKKKRDNTAGTGVNLDSGKGDNWE